MQDHKPAHVRQRAQVASEGCCCGCCDDVAATPIPTQQPPRSIRRFALATGLPGIAVSLCLAAVALSAVLLFFALGPAQLSEHAHADLSALPLAIVALAYLLHQPLRRPSLSAIVKPALLAAAFLLWATYQVNPGAPLAVNDLAIALFVLDIALVIGSDVRNAIRQAPA